MTARADEIKRAREAAAAELGQLESHWSVRRYALLMVAHDDLTARFATGADFDIDKLTKLESAMAEIRASVPPPVQEVKVIFVPPTDAAPPEGPSVAGSIKCRRCGWKPPGKDFVERCYRCGLAAGGDTAKPWEPINLENDQTPFAPVAKKAAPVSESTLGAARSA